MTPYSRSRRTKLSGPPIDRIDIHIEVPAVAYRQLNAARRGTDTATMRARVHGALSRLGSRGLIRQTNPAQNSADYHITATGRTALQASGGPDLRQQIATVACWAARQGFRTLLDEVYSQAPDFATRSVLRRGAQPA